MAHPIRPLDWATWLNRKVRVYRNLHNGLMSIQGYRAGVGWRVVGHVDQCVLSAVEFQISYPVHRKIMSDLAMGRRRRQVCAWATGTLIAQDAEEPALTPVRLGYNPYKSAEFYDWHTHQPLLSHCSRLAVIQNIAYVSQDALPMTNLASAPAQLNLFDVAGLLQWLSMPLAIAA